MNDPIEQREAAVCQLGWKLGPLGPVLTVYLFKDLFQIGDQLLNQASSKRRRHGANVELNEAAEKGVRPRTCRLDESKESKRSYFDHPHVVAEEMVI